MISTNFGSLSIGDVEAIKQLEAGCRLPEIDKRVKPNVEFLDKLRELLATIWRRATTATTAWQVWIAIYELENRIADRHRVAAEISFWYSVNPFTLNQDELAGLYTNLHRVKAQQRIENGNFDATDYEHVYDLTLVAYGDEQRALAARAASLRMLIAQQTKRGNA